MDKEIIKLPIGDIKNNYFLYELEMVKDGLNQRIKPTKKDKQIFFHLTLFLLIGLPLIIISPFKTFKFFYKKTNFDPLNPDIYNIGGGKIMKRVVLSIIYLILLILYPYISFFNLGFFDTEISSYDWTGLHEKILSEGYQPKTNSYIRVSKYKNDYICIDGNHRHKILESFYQL